MKRFILGVISSLLLWFWALFAQNISPDGVKISVKDPVIMGEATNLKISIQKNWSTMTTYDGSILIMITEENWTTLKENEFTVPSNWIYSFLSSDLGEKEFQRWLEIKKEWRFYIEVRDLNNNEDQALWKQLITVIKKGEQDAIEHIDVFYPIPNVNLIGEKIEIIGECKKIPNSKATIYIDDKEVWVTNVASDWSINFAIWNITAWSHELLIEIPDLEWNIMWRSDKIFFTASAAWNSGIKSVIVNPEKWLMVWDMTNITAYTDDMIETVKLRLSDRPENDSIVMSKNWIGEFSQNVFLIGTWDINLSFDTSASNNTVNNSYENYKTIKVADVPSIYDTQIETSTEMKTANISWKVTDESIVSSYLINYRVEWSNQSWQDRSTVPSFKFRDVPYDTIINLNITPYRENSSKHWAASKTIQFVITKAEQNACWNWICDVWESYETCPQDCSPSCWNWICDAWESYETCPQDCEWEWKSIFTCPPQSVATHTEKIWNSYYLVRDKADMITKYIVYSSPYADWRDKVKVYETTDTSYEYPFDYNAKEDVFMYFWVIWICENWEELELTGATKVQVWPAENLFLLICLTLLIYSWIKLFRQTE